MRTRVVLHGVALLLLGSTLEAVADGGVLGPPDPYAYTPPPIVGQYDYDWSGTYIGGRRGGATAAWGWNSFQPTEHIGHHANGLLGGVQAGMQKQWNTLLLGVEVSYTAPGLGTTSPSALVPGSRRTADLSNLLMVAGRGGVTWQNILAYFDVGYASADVDFRSSDPVTGLVATSLSKRGEGWVTGLGIEYGIRPNITLGVEYDFIHIDAGPRVQIPSAVGILGSQADSGVDVQAVMARLNYKFGVWPFAGPVR